MARSKPQANLDNMHAHSVALELQVGVLRGGLARKTIKPFSHIGRMEGDEDASLSSDGQHDSPVEAASIAAMSCVN